MNKIKLLFNLLLSLALISCASYDPAYQSPEEEVPYETLSTCALIGGVTGAALGSIESKVYAGWGTLVGAQIGLAYCNSYGKQEIVQDEVIENMPTKQVAINTPSTNEVVVYKDAKGVETVINQQANIKLDVKFDTAKSTIKQDYVGDIGALANFMKRYANTTVILEGHTDSIGSEASNLKLSQARADSVRNELVSKYKIAESRIYTRGFGESRPVADNINEAGRSQNRRTVAAITVN